MIARRSVSALTGALLVLGLVGCPADDAPGADGGAIDAAVADDGGAPLDAGMPGDAGVAADSGVPDDARTGDPDAGGAGASIRLSCAPSHSGGGSHTCAALDDGDVRCWGNGGFAQLGDGSRMNRSMPVAVVGLTDAVDVSIGRAHSCALRATGDVVCWGSDEYGMVGDGTPSSFQLTPEPVTGLGDAIAISGGGLFTCALRSTGRVVCWGNDEFGQLGDGGTTAQASPIEVPGVDDVVQIAAGGNHACARRASGDVRCWGNHAGPGGDPAPATIAGVSDAVDVTAGDGHTCVVRAGGEVLCWGSGAFGQLGDGSTTSFRAAPGPVSGLTDAVAVSASGLHTCARRAGGTVVCWGGNGAGELGDGTTADRSTPVAVTGLAGVVELASGARHTCAATGPREVLCWGWNFVGQLGDGTTTDRTVPTAVVGL